MLVVVAAAAGPWAGCNDGESATAGCQTVGDACAVLCASDAGCDPAATREVCRPGWCEASFSVTGNALWDCLVLVGCGDAAALNACLAARTAPYTDGCEGLTLWLRDPEGCEERANCATACPPGFNGASCRPGAPGEPSYCRCVVTL